MEYLDRKEIEEYNEKSQTGYWKMEIISGANNRMYVDKTMQTLMGMPDDLTPEECCAFFGEHIHPDDRNLMMPYAEETMRGNAEVIYRYLHPTAGEIQVRCGGRRIKTEGDKTVIVGYHKEIADTIQMQGGRLAEEELQKRSRDLQVQESQKYYWRLMDRASCGIVVYTIADHHIQYMNAEALRIYGAKSIEEVQNRLKEAPFVKLDIYTARQLKRMAQEDVSHDYECIISGMDNQDRNVIVHSEVTISLAGERCIYSTIMDISENMALRDEKSILNVLCKDFMYVYLCDFERNTAVELKVNQSTYKGLELGINQTENVLGNDLDDYFKVTKYYYDKYVDTSYSMDFLEKMDAHHLKEYMKAHGGSFTYRYKLKKNPTGAEYFEVKSYKLPNTDGYKIILSVRIIDDVIREEQKQREEIKNKLDQIKGLASQYVGLFFANLDTQTIVSYGSPERNNVSNKDGFRNGTITLPEALRDSVDKFVHPDFKAEMSKFTDTEYIRYLLMNKTRSEHRFLLVNDDGSTSWAEIVFMKLSDEEDAYPTDIAIGYLDVDDEVREELEQQYRQKRDLEAIQGLANEYAVLYFVDLNTDTYKRYYLRDESTNILRNAVGLKGSFSKLHEKTMMDYCHPDQREQMLQFADPEVIREVLSEQTKYTCRIKAMGTNGYNWCEFVLIRLDHEEVLNRVAVGYININETVKAELEQQNALKTALIEAKAANKAKTTFLFNMSHDIRTPMNAIMGFRDLLEKHQDNPVKRQDYLDKIKTSNDVLLSIINNVLEMTRIEQGHMELDETAHGVEAICDGIASMFREMMEAKDIQFEVKNNVEHNKYLFMDATKVREVFINLVSNAYKYTNSGGKIVASIDELPCEREGYARIRTIISDNGIGMSEAFIPHIFEEFARENSTTDAKVEGTGLGMPIVKRLVEFMGGTIEVKSKKGIGTEVIVTTDNRIAQLSDILTYEKHDTDIDMSGKRILLAEDNELNAEIAIEVLTESGLLIDRAEDGKRCIEMLEVAPEGYYDLILMDIQMPNMNGYEATRAIREMSNEAKAKTPIVAMTANAFEEDKRNAFAAGVDGHISKPISIKDIMSELARILK